MQDEKSPFQRLAELLADHAPGLKDGEEAIDLTLGEPRHAMPSFIADVITANAADFCRYPPIRGTDDFRSAISDWLDNRYDLKGLISTEQNILPLNGTREGLFHAAIGARDWLATSCSKPPEKSAILLPNPFYHAYAAGAHAMGAEVVYLNGMAESSFLPDLDMLAYDTELLDRAIAFYFASPANPQGSTASLDSWKKLITLSRKHNFMVFADECYSELYRNEPPVGILEACDGNLSNIVTFHSLSKRSNLAGLRCGFAAGDGGFLTHWTKYRNMAAPQVPLPLMAAGAAAYRDEEHVIENRRLYNEKYDAADRILGTNLGYQRPEGGFFLWLDVSAHSDDGDDVTITEKLWTEAGIRVIPGSYLARTNHDGVNPGTGFVRIAMVADLATTIEALNRLKACLIGA